MSHATKTVPVLAFSNGHCTPSAPRSGHLRLVVSSAVSTATRHPLRPSLLPAEAPVSSKLADADRWDQVHRP